MKMKRGIAARFFAAAFYMVVSVLASAPPALAQTGGGDVAPPGRLRVDEVLASSATHFPQILESLARRRAVAGDVLAADGAFDLVFGADGFDRVNGTFDGAIFNTDVRRNLRAFGGQVYGGYRVSRAEFPVYENINNTNQGGEFKVGALFSLLRDRAIDDRRFGMSDSRLAFRQADFEVLLTRIGVQYQASIAYWRWVTAGRQLEVYEELLRIALERESGLEEQVRRGARARIFLTENRQNITRRQRLATEARRDFMTTANDLSLYYRDELGEPIAPSEKQLPPPGGEALPAELFDVELPPISALLMQRPEVQILRTGLERAQGRIALSKNELLPSLDVNAELSRDVGAVGQGGSTFDSTDAIVGFKFSVPLQRREAKGRLRRAEAEYEAVRQQRRQLQDQIEIDIRNILIDLNVSGQIVSIAGQEVDQAETMQQAEQTRFASGASDFFLVNIREETTADARIRLFLADLETRIARANYDAATVNLPRLGIDETGAPDVDAVLYGNKDSRATDDPS